MKQAWERTVPVPRRADGARCLPHVHAKAAVSVDTRAAGHAPPTARRLRRRSIGCRRHHRRAQAAVVQMEAATMKLEGTKNRHPTPALQYLSCASIGRFSPLRRCAALPRPRRRRERGVTNKAAKMTLRRGRNSCRASRSTARAASPPHPPLSTSHRAVTDRTRNMAWRRRQYICRVFPLDNEKRKYDASAGNTPPNRPETGSLLASGAPYANFGLRAARGGLYTLACGPMWCSPTQRACSTLILRTCGFKQGATRAYTRLNICQVPRLWHIFTCSFPSSLGPPSAHPRRRRPRAPA